MPLRDAPMKQLSTPCEAPRTQGSRSTQQAYFVSGLFCVTAQRCWEDLGHCSLRFQRVMTNPTTTSDKRHLDAILSYALSALVDGEVYPTPSFSWLIRSRLHPLLISSCTARYLQGSRWWLHERINQRCGLLLAREPAPSWP